MFGWIEGFAELRTEFVGCAKARLETINGLLAGLEKDPAERTALDPLRREFHNFVGEGAMFEFPQITELGQEGEKRCCVLLESAERLARTDLARLRSLSWMIAAALEHDRSGPAAAVPPVPSPRELPPEVLIVDGDAEIRRALAALLDQEGLATHSVRTYAEAIHYLKSRCPDGLITATDLPDGSGYELVDQVRGSSGGHLPAIVLVGPGGGILDKAEAIHCGADGYFERPVDFCALMRRLQHLLGRKVAQAGRVLVMEDDPHQAAGVRAVLESAGYQVLCCERPEQFEAELAAFQPDLVLMDILLPGMSGFDLVKYLRQNDRHATLPVVFLTTQGQLQARIETARVGGDDYLEKPVPPPLLVSTVAARVERSRLLRSLLDQDGLTRLLTHTAFLERARAVVAERWRNPRSSAVWVMIDIDHFKSINDRYGHPVGDRVLESLSAVLRRHLRQADTIGRYGGEEFAVLLDEVNEEEARRVIDRLRQSFAAVQHPGHNGAEFAVSFSAGIAELRRGMSLESWRVAADQALYAAKGAGRNCIRIAPAAGAVKVA